jgi:hypothetical protein
MLADPRVRGIVVELAGPAGAGKTSLAKALCLRDAAIREGLRPSVHYLFWNACVMLPTMVTLHRPPRRATWKALKRVLYISTLKALVDRRRRQCPVILFDEGPVYMLSRLLYFADGRPDGRAFHPWWQSAITGWAETLHLIVWMDASDEILTQRIRTRPGRPPIADLSEGPLLRFLGRYRACYRTVVRQLEAAGGPRVVRLDTGHVGTDVLANQVLAALGRTRVNPEPAPHALTESVRLLQ